MNATAKKNEACDQSCQVPADWIKPGDEQGVYDSLPTSEGFGPYATQNETEATKNPNGRG
jgi:hypothetical protein